MFFGGHKSGKVSYIGFPIVTMVNALLSIYDRFQMLTPFRRPLILRTVFKMTLSHEVVYLVKVEECTNYRFLYVFIDFL